MTVTNENEPPEITSDGGGATATVNVAENTTAVTDVNRSTDADGDCGLTYTMRRRGRSAVLD